MAINDYLRTSSLDINGNLNFRRLSERRSYNNLLKGEALKVDVGQSLTESDGSPHTDIYANPPEWVQISTGRNQAFTINEIEHNKEQSWNVYNSGSAPLEQSHIPASASAYYVKNSTLTTRTYKWVASSSMTTQPAHRSDTFNSSLGLKFSASLTNFRPTAPGAEDFARFSIDIPDKGKLIDIKVWVEVLHNSGSPDKDDGHYSGSSGSPAYDDTDPEYHGGPLGSFWMVLRPPSSGRKFMSLPWENDEKIVARLRGTEKFKASFYDAGDNKFGHGFWGSTYPLWIGRSGSSNHHNDNSESKMSTWQRNRHIRAVFYDTSGIPNPYQLDPLYLNSDLSSIDPARKTGSHDMSHIIDPPGPSNPAFHSYFQDIKGRDRPWIGDPDDQSIAGVVAGVNDGVGSPPVGWLNGPGGTSLSDEWPTSGSNYGPTTIRPAIPILPDIIGKTKLTGIFQSSTTLGLSKGDSAEFVGFRPGLRGSEINGRWDLLMLNNIPVGRSPSGSISYKQGYANQAKQTFAPPNNVASWIRQWRLELTFEENSSFSSPNIGKLNNLRFKSSGKRFKTENKPGNRVLGDRIAIISGSAGLEWTTNLGGFPVTTAYSGNFSYGGGIIPQGDYEVELFSVVEDQPYTTVGLTANTASSDYAVFTQITGTLADSLGQNPHYFLQNEFGTPFIPISSGSGVDPTFDIFTSAQTNATTISNTLNPKPIVSRAITLRSVLSKFNITKTSADLMKDATDSLDEDS